jgi:hypothetical protein
LAALHVGAKAAVMTGERPSRGGHRSDPDAVLRSVDYPSEQLLDNIRRNVARNEKLLGDGNAIVLGHLWGSTTVDVVGCLAPFQTENQAPPEFDVAVVAECLWLHHLHIDLLRSIHTCLKDGGEVGGACLSVLVLRTSANDDCGVIARHT